MAQFNPARLTVARQRRGLTKTEIASRTGISVQSVTFYEKGERAPTPHNLDRLAHTLTFPAKFFLRPDPPDLPVNAVSFRALSRLTARQQDRALGAATLALEISRWIDDNFQLPAVDIPRLPNVDPETAAQAVRREWGWGDRPISNLIHLLEAHGVRVFSLAEECVDVDAFSFWRHGIPFIFLNTFKSAERSRMDAAHELGHLVLHWDRHVPRGRSIELEAQTFGAAFLMPRGDVIAEAPRGGRLTELVRAKRRWNVAVSNLAYRMHNLGLLSDWQHRSLFIEMGQKGYRKTEPDPSPRETSKLLSQVLHVMRQEGKSKSDIAGELAIPVDEFEKVTFGLVLSSFDGNATTPRPPQKRPQLRVVR